VTLQRDPKEEELRQLRAAADAAWRATPRLMMVGWGKRRERNERLAREALEAENAVLRAMLGPVGPGPGDEYFPDFPPDAQLDENERTSVREIRGALARLEPAYVRPEDTSGSFDDMFVYLVIRHTTEPGVQIRLTFGDGYLSLTWPGGEEHNGWEWTPRLTGIVEALLGGRNVQTFHCRLGRVYAIDTEVWDDNGTRYDMRRKWRLRQAPLALMPLLPTSRHRRSISFDRAPAIVAD
jgi:hypothetical protein